MARLSDQCFVTLNATSGALLIAEYGASYVRALSGSTGIITSLAITGVALGGPVGLAIGIDGTTLYTSEWTTNLVKRISSGGVSSTVAGGGGSVLDGVPGTSASLGNLMGISADGVGGFYVASYGQNVIKYLNASGFIALFAGTTSSGGFSGEGGLARGGAKLSTPYHAIVDSAGLGVFIVSWGLGTVESSG